MDAIGSKRIFAFVIVLLFFGAAFAVISPVGAKTGSRADLTVGDDEIDYTVSGTETFDYVYILEGGTLVVPSGTTINAKQVFLQGGSVKVTGGTIKIDLSTAGNSQDASFAGVGQVFELRDGGTITLKGADAGTSFGVSQGGNAAMNIKLEDHAIIDQGTITATAGNGYMRSTPWFEGVPLENWASAGGSSSIKIFTNRTSEDYIDVTQGTFSVTGGNAAHAPNGGNGAINKEGPGGGYITDASVGGYVGAGGHGNITIDSTSVDVKDSIFSGQGGNGGNAGNAGNGALGNYYNNPGGGGGGGGYAGGKGALYTGAAGKSATAAGHVGSGGCVLIQLFADYMNVTDTDFSGTGGNGGNAGNGGNGATGITTYYHLYSGSGGGGGYGGGGGGSYYGKSAGAGSAMDYVAKGGSITVKIVAEYYLDVDGIDIVANGGDGGNGGNGGQGTQTNSYSFYYSFGGGAGGMGGGGGGGYYFNPGAGSTSGEVASGGNVTVWIICSGHLEITNTSLNLNGGDGGKGGDGGRGGYAGGGGGGFGGGGGNGYNYQSPKGGKGAVGDLVGMGGSVDIIFRGIESVVVIDNVITATGGKGGDSGTGGPAGTAGGGGGGIAGGGGTYNGQGGESAIQGEPCDGGDVKLTVESKMPSVATSNTFALTGGTKGDGRNSPGGGGSSGGTGKGRSTRDGTVNMFIPMSIPHPLEPEENALLEGDVTFKWSIAHPAWDGTRERKVLNFFLQIDNNSDFKSPDYDKDSISPTEDFFTVPKDQLIGGIVYWRMKAVYEIGQTGWSEVKTFRHNIEPELIKEIPSLKLDEDTNALNKIDLNTHFTDDLWPNKLNYTIIEQEYPDKVLAKIEDDRFISFYTVEDDWYGSSQIKVKATDKNGLFNTSNKFTVTVVAVNDAPVILEIPDQTVTEDQQFVLDLTPYVSDVDNNLTQLTVQTDSTYITANGISLVMLYTYGALGHEMVTVTVSDLRLNAYAEFNVSIQPVNDAPTIKRIPDRTMEEDSPLSFSLIPYGKDEEDQSEQLDWSVVGGQLVTATVDNEGLLTLSSEQDQSGTDQITLTVTDKNGASASTMVTVVVLPVNDPPEISPIEDQEWPVGEPLEKNLETYVSDIDNLKSELIVTSDSQFVTSIVGFTVILEYPLDTLVDVDEVTISVSDGVDQSSTRMSIALKKPPRFVNDILDLVLEQGQSETVDLKIFAVDDRDDQDQLVWTVSNKGDKSLVSASVKNKNSLTVKAGTGKTGATTLRVTVTDSEGFSAYQDVRVEVKESATGGAMGATQENLMVPLLLIVVLVALVGATIGYKYKLKRERINRIKRARDARMKRQTAGKIVGDGVSVTGTTLSQDADRLETKEAGPSAVQLAMMSRAAPLCFACGTKTRPDERGRYICPKCGRMSN